MSESNLDYLVRRAEELAAESKDITGNDWFQWAGKAKHVLEELAKEVRRQQEQK